MGDRQIGAQNRLYSSPTPLNFPKREFVEMSDCAMGIMLCLRGKWRVCQNEDVWAAGPARRCRPAKSPLVSILTHPLTGISLAQTVADGCVFATAARRFASICRAGTLHVIGEKTHVTGRCVQYKTDCLGRSWPQAVCLCYRGVEGTRAMLFHQFETYDPPVGLMPWLSHILKTSFFTVEA